MIGNKDLEVVDGLEVVDLEDGRLGERIRHQVLSSHQPDLRVWAADEAHELAVELAYISYINWMYIRMERKAWLRSSDFAINGIKQITNIPLQVQSAF